MCGWLNLNHVTNPKQAWEHWGPQTWRVHAYMRLSSLLRHVSCHKCFHGAKKLLVNCGTLEYLIQRPNFAYGGFELTTTTIWATGLREGWVSKFWKGSWGILSAPDHTATCLLGQGGEQGGQNVEQLEPRAMGGQLQGCQVAACTQVLPQQRNDGIAAGNTSLSKNHETRKRKKKEMRQADI